MNRFEHTGLWQSTLATQLDPDLESSPRRKLRTAFESMRERSVVLASEIARTLPDFTVHDITHIDALWEMAQLIAGEDYALTPSEAFVLGGAFLIHDLGMGLAAYPRGLPEIREHLLWKDTVAAEIKKQHGRMRLDAGAATDPSLAIEQLATATVLRQMHAERAEFLALTGWKDERGNVYHLIEDPELRTTFGRIIGLIAHSHWWTIDELEQRLPQELGAPGGFANTWTVNPLKLACLLRAADVAHLDERRAPAFLRALRRPSGTSLQHWIFQERLYQPRRDKDRLIFSSKSGFVVEEAPAWWLCYEVLQEVARELERVDSFLSDIRQPRFAAKGVAYIEKPERLAKLIPTDGWVPVDARVKVGAVASLVAKLGGAELYGQHLEVPLRELIQNGADAIRARRALEDLPETWGVIRVAAISQDGEEWIEVTDMGVGMSVPVLTGPFLDFGLSFWGSQLMHSEFPGLESTTFCPTGKYGIGFFSVFMWGDRVQVITRRFERGREDTKVLEFEEGVAGRPMLREAKPNEFLKEGGTKVRVRLKPTVRIKRLLQRHSYYEVLTLPEVCGRLCATLDVSVEVHEASQGWTTAVLANDWKDIDGEALLVRINRPFPARTAKRLALACKRFGRVVQPMYNAHGEIVGRGCVNARSSEEKDVLAPNGLVTVGGFAASQLTGIAGVLMGRPEGAARNSGFPLIDVTSLAKFATNSIPQLKRIYRSPGGQQSLSEIIVALGGAPEGLIVTRSASGWLTPAALRRWAATADQILLVEDYVFSLAAQYGGDVSIDPAVLTVKSSHPTILQGVGFFHWPSSATSQTDDGLIRYGRTLRDFVVECVADAWKVSSDQLDVTGKREIPDRKVGTVGEKPLREYAYTLRRPS